MKKIFAAIVLATLASTSIAQAGIPSLSTEKLSINSAAIKSTSKNIITNIITAQNTNFTIQEAPIHVSWSITGAIKKAGRGIKKAGIFVAEHPYGRRCKPTKYFIPACNVKGTSTRTTRDHRARPTR